MYVLHQKTSSGYSINFGFDALKYMIIQMNGETKSVQYESEDRPVYSMLLSLCFAFIITVADHSIKKRKHV